MFAAMMCARMRRRRQLAKIGATRSKELSRGFKTKVQLTMVKKVCCAVDVNESAGKGKAVVMVARISSRMAANRDDTRSDECKSVFVLLRLHDCFPASQPGRAKSDNRIS